MRSYIYIYEDTSSRAFARSVDVYADVLYIVGFADELGMHLTMCNSSFVVKQGGYIH